MHLYPVLCCWIALISIFNSLIVNIPLLKLPAYYPHVDLKPVFMLSSHFLYINYMPTDSYFTALPPPHAERSSTQQQEIERGAYVRHDVHKREGMDHRTSCCAAAIS